MRKLLFLLILLLVLALPAVAQYVTVYSVDTDPEGWSPTTCSLTSPPIVLIYHNGATVEVCTCQSSNWTCSSAIATPPAGSTTEVQFNSSGAFGADSDWTYNSTRNTLTVGGHEFGLLDDLGSADTTGMIGLTDGTGASPFDAAGRAVIAAQPSAGVASDLMVITGQGLLTLFLDTDGTATSFNYDRDGDGTYETTLDSTITLDPDDDGTAEFSLTGSAVTITEDLTVSDGTAADWTMTFNDDDIDGTLKWDESEDRLAIDRGLFMAVDEDVATHDRGIRYPMTENLCSGDNLTSCDNDTDCSTLPGPPGGTCSVALYDTYGAVGLHRARFSSFDNRKDYVWYFSFNETPGNNRIDSTFYSYAWTLESNYRSAAGGDYKIEQNWDVTNWAGTKNRMQAVEINMGPNAAGAKLLGDWKFFADLSQPGTTPVTFWIDEISNHGHVAAGDIDQTVGQHNQWAALTGVRVIDDNLAGGTFHSGIRGILDIPTTYTGSLSQAGGLSFLVDWEPGTTGTFGNLYAALIDTDISSNNANAALVSSTGSGLTIDTDFTAGSAAQKLSNYHGLDIDIDSSGANAEFGGTMAHIRLRSPTPTGHYPSGGNRAALWIDDQDTSEGWDAAIRIEALDASATDARNFSLWMLGGNWNNGSVVFGASGNDVLYFDQTNNKLRLSVDGRPGSETAGDAVVTGTGSATYGPMAWVASGTSCTTACSNLGLACQNAYPAAGGAAVGCADTAADNNCHCK